MDRETLKSKIVSKLGNTSLSDRSITDYVDNILKLVTDDAQVSDAYIEAQCNILKSIEGQQRHEMSEWIKNHQTPDPKQEPEPSPKPQDNGNDTAEILKQLKAMQDNYNALKTDFDNQRAKAASDAVISQVKSTLRSKIKSATGEDPNAFVFDVTTSAIQLGENPNVDELVKGLTDTYNANLKKAGIPESSPSLGGAGGDGGSSAIDSFFEQKALEGKFPAKQ